MNKLLLSLFITFIQQIVVTICDNSAYNGYGGYGKNKGVDFAMSVNIQREDIPIKTSYGRYGPKKEDGLVIRLGESDEPYKKKNNYGNYGYAKSRYAPDYGNIGYGYYGYNNDGGYDLSYAADYAHQHIYGHGFEGYGRSTFDHGYKLEDYY